MTWRRKKMGTDTRSMIDQSKLLDQLKIYRSPSAGSGGGAWIAALLIAAVPGAGATYLPADSTHSGNADAAGHLDAYPDWDIPASVIAVIPTADRAKATVRVRISVNERGVRTLPDMGAKVAFFG